MLSGRFVFFSVLKFVCLDTGVRSIATYIPQLRELSLSDCSGIGDAGIAELSRLGPSLRYLSICRIGPSMQYSDKSTDCQDAGLRLETIFKSFSTYFTFFLNIFFSSVFSNWHLIDRLVLKHCYKLRYLNCRGGTIISDSTLQYIAAVCTKLRYILLIVHCTTYLKGTGNAYHTPIIFASSYLIPLLFE